MEKFHIHVPDEFSFQQNIRYLAEAGNECMYEVKDSRVRRAIRLEGEEPAVFEVEENMDGGLLVTVFSELTNEGRLKIKRFITDWFDLETDLQPFYEMAENDRYLKRAVTEFYGLRNMGIPDLFEAVCWGIIGQQINLAFAFTLKRRFVEAYGESVEAEGTSYWLFPEPHVIARLTVEDLMALQMTRRKSEYLIHVADLIASRDLTKEKLLAAKDFKDAERMLTRIRGIGPWTANYVLMRCLRFQSALPLADVGLLNAIKFLDNLEEKPTREAVLEIFALWGGWEAYATFYLWRFLY